MKTLEEYEKLLKGKTCKWCNTPLPTKIEHYPHDGGWWVQGHFTRLWLYVTCPKCGYQWALWKLGIPKVEG